MKRKLIALAVAGAFVPAIAMADTSVTIYGTMNGAWNYVEAKGATAVFVAPGIAVQGANLDGRSRVDIDSSNIGFRVKEDLGGGLAAWGQCEISMDFSDSDSGGSVCTRNAGVGLEGSFGNIFLGQWDSPLKQQGAIDVMGNTHIVSWVGIMSSPGFNVSSTTGGNGVQNTATGVPTNTGATLSFDRRQQNTVNYYTPNWSGFQAKVQVSANEEKPADALPGVVNPAVLGVAGLDPFMWGASVGYENGPFYANVAYEQHDDFGNFPLNIVAPAGNVVTGNDDNAWRVALGYKFGNFRITGAYEELSYDADGVTAAGLVSTSDVERDAFYIGASYAAGPHYFAVSYANADELDCSGTVAGAPIVAGLCNNTGADMYAVRYAYSLSKRTEVFAHYVTIDNDPVAQYTFGVNGLTTVAPGADPEGFGVGVKHKF